MGPRHSSKSVNFGFGAVGGAFCFVFFDRPYLNFDDSSLAVPLKMSHLDIKCCFGDLG